MSAEPYQSSPYSGPGQPRRRSRRGTIIGLLVILAILVGIVGARMYFGRDDAVQAQVGDCVKQDGQDSLQVVACDDPAATLKVVGRVEDKTRIQAGISACSGFANAVQSYWEGVEGEEGLVLCLARNTP